MQQPGYVFGEAYFGIVDGLIPDNFPGVGDAPELSGVIRDAVEDVEGDAMFVFYLRRLHGLTEQLLHVELADVPRKLADIAFWRLVLEEAGIDLTRHDYPDLDDLQLSPQAAASVEEAEWLVSSLGPAVETVRPRIILGADAVSQPCVVRPLVPLRGLIGTRRDHSPHALLQREPVDALHHVHVAPLTPVERLKVITFRLQMTAMDHHVHVRKQGLQRRVFVREQIEDLDPLDNIARGVHLPDVDESQVVTLPEGRQELARYVASSPRQQYTPPCLHVVRIIQSQESSPRSKPNPYYRLTFAGFPHEKQEFNHQKADMLTSVSRRLERAEMLTNSRS